MKSHIMKTVFMWPFFLGMIFLFGLTSELVMAEPDDINVKPNDDTTTISQYNGDSRIQALAYQLLHYSVDLQKGEKILLSVTNNNSVPLAKAIIDEVYKIGGLPFVDMFDEELNRAALLGATAEQVQMVMSWDSIKYGAMNAIIIIDGTENISALADVPAEKTNLWAKFWGEPIWGNIILPKLKWCYMRYPSRCMAQSANMSTEAFSDFYFRVCTMDYPKLAAAMEPLVKLMQTTDKVRIVGAGTDLTFSIKDIPVIPCAGKKNIPDGELFTAPVKYSVNGILTCNTPSAFYGTSYQDIRLEFKDGKIIKASANKTDKLNELLNVDEGARYLGEFSFGLNPFIEKPMNDILFDEKIAMSFHLAIGNSYDEASNGNKSAIHWDLVNIQTPEYGGGEIWFDGKLIRKDGLFVLPELQSLNPENFKKAFSQ